MIGRYNRSQLIRAAFALFGGLVCVFLAYLFFRYVPALVAWQFGYPWTPLTANLVAAFGLVAGAFGGYRTWRAKGGLQGYHESALYHDLGGESAGAFVVDQYAHRVTAPAYVLSQIFLAGPLQLLSVRTTLTSLLPNDPELESRLESTLAVLRAANKWQSLADHPDRKREILYLAQMDLIDFSSHKGVPRIKAR